MNRSRWLLATLGGAGVVLALWGQDAGISDAQAQPAPIQGQPADLRAAAAQVLETYCIDCHGPDKQKGKIRFDALETIDSVDRPALFADAREAVQTQAMPPAKSAQPTRAQRELLQAYFADQLTGDEKKKLDEKLQRPESGNYTNHEDLFSGKYADLPGYTHDRRWLISEFIFEDKINRLLDYRGQRTIDGQTMNVVGDNGVNLSTRFGGQTLRQNITNPFLLPTTIGVRYYANESLTSGHLLTMISNARKIAGYMTAEETMRAHYPAMHRIMQADLQHRQTMRSRTQFLNDHIERLLTDLYQDRHADLLPAFVRATVDPPQDKERRETNLGLLDRYEAQDLNAIYLGLGQYTREGVSYEQVIEQCERDWFFAGVHEKRIHTRVSIMKVLHSNWDMSLIYEDVRKKNLRPPTYKPMNDAEMAVVRQALQKHRAKGDNYQQIIDKCLAQWESDFRAQHASAGSLDDAKLTDLVVELYARVFERGPTAEELRDNLALMRTYLAKLGTQASIAKLIESLILSSEMYYRSEFGQGEPDAHGRRMMSPRDASYALAYALTDSSPDAELVAAAESGRLNTREDYRREVLRMLSRRDQYTIIDETVQKANFSASITNQPIRKLRFFREFFGYPKAMSVFKDDARFGAGGIDGPVGRLVEEADLLVAYILEQDQHVFEELLTTDRFYVYHSGDNAAMQAASDRLRTIYDYFKNYDWQNFTQEQLYEHMPFIVKMQMRGTVFPDFQTNEKRQRDWVRSFKSTMASLELRFAKGQTNAIPYDELPMAYWHKGNATGRTGQVMRGEQVATFFNIDYRDWDYPTQQPAVIPNRRGMLTHPAWLIAHSLNTETDPVRRGKWVREKLLAGTIPDVPITVDAVVPEDPHKTLRQRLDKKTGEDYCWTCHQKMDPLGLPFEIYDDFGRYRTRERLEHAENLITPQKQAPHVEGVQLPLYKTLPVDARGEITGTGEATLDGQVDNAMDLAERLAKSRLVRQSIIRHAFRYFLGRNETLSDSKTLIDAEQAYLDSNGSFDAVIVSLLTSDSFIYRKSAED